MSHDFKKYKFLKKIIGLIGYKLVDKNYTKLERSLEKYTIEVKDILKPLIKIKKIKKIIQVGANDGKTDDFLSDLFNKELDAILIEPIEGAFKRLKENYKTFKNIKCLNFAVGLNNHEKKIYTTDIKDKKYYQKKFKSDNVEFLDVLSSFDKNHLIKHGIKNKDITSKIINCITFKQLIEDYNYQDLDLLTIDTEGFDYTLVNNFIDTINLKPLIIFEWMHIKDSELIVLLKKLKKKDYLFVKIGKDLIVYQEDFLFN